jgi:uncharacterized membrane protein
MITIFGIIIFAVIATARQMGRTWAQIASSLFFTCLLIIAAFIVGAALFGVAQ